MLSMFKTGLLGLSLGAGLLLGGCATDTTPATHEMSSTAVMCDKCQMVWVKSGHTSGGGKGPGTTSYSWSQKMECPDCRDAAANFFATGNLKHECKACGGNMTPCAAHDD